MRKRNMYTILFRSFSLGPLRCLLLSQKDVFLQVSTLVNRWSMCCNHKKKKKTRGCVKQAILVLLILGLIPNNFLDAFMKRTEQYSHASPLVFTWTKTFNGFLLMLETTRSIWVAICISQRHCKILSLWDMHLEDILKNP